MVGDDRVRHCGVCDKHVYTLDTLSAPEVRELVLKTEGRICWRFFVRKDGTVLTRDCPVGLARVRRRSLALAGALCVLVLGTTAQGLRELGWWDWSQTIGALSARVAELLRSSAPWLIAEDARREAYTMGDRAR